MGTKSIEAKIEIIQLMRLLCSIMIILFHSNIIGMHGYFAADIFNVLSGFILVYSTHKVVSSKYFFYNRLVRIIPLYWFFTLITYALISFMPQISLMSEAKIPYLLKSLFFIPFINGKGAGVPIMGVGWTLNYEMFFCLIFWLGMKINHRYRGLISSFIIITLVVIGRVFKLDNYILRFYTDSLMLEFVFGIVIFYMKDLIKEYAQKRWVQISGYVFVIVSMAILIFDLGVDTNIIRGIRLGIPAFLLVLISIISFEKITFPRRLIALGNATYSIYLLEYFTTALYKVLAGKLGFIMESILFATMIAGTLAAGYLIYILIEKPLYLKLRKSNSEK